MLLSLAENSPNLPTRRSVRTGPLSIKKWPGSLLKHLKITTYIVEFEIQVILGITVSLILGIRDNRPGFSVEPVTRNTCHGCHR